MSEWIRNILRPMIKEAVNEAVSEAVAESADKTDKEYYKGVAYGEARAKLKADQEHERELYRMFDEGVKHGKELERAELGVIEEISAEEFDRLANEEPEQTTRTEIPEGFGFVGTIDDISLSLGEEVSA